MKKVLMFLLPAVSVWSTAYADREVLVHDCQERANPATSWTVIEDYYRHAHTGKLTNGFIKHLTSESAFSAEPMGEGFLETSNVVSLESLPPQTRYVYSSVTGTRFTLTYSERSDTGRGVVSYVEMGKTYSLQLDCRKDRVTLITRE